MAEYSASVIPIIEANYEKFTAVEKSIADFFIHNEKKMDFSAKRMAGELHVSEASLSRFAQKMGYTGYREFIYRYQPSVNVKVPNVQAHSLEVLNAYQELLNKTYSLIDENQIARVVQLIANKRRIFLYGFGSSGLTAQEMKLRLLRLGIDAEAVTEFHQLVMNEARVTKDCLVIGISLSGATKEVYDAMQEAKAKQAATVVISSKNKTEWNEEFDEVLLTAVKENLEFGNVVSPQFPILVILDLIYAGCLNRNTRNTKEQYDTLLWKRIKQYHS